VHQDVTGKATCAGVRASEQTGLRASTQRSAP
jgi:hypothetical protein